MAAATIAQAVTDDCTILLERALLRKQVCMFGVDGNGLYGRDTFARWCTVSRIEMALLELTDDIGSSRAQIIVHMHNYDAQSHGHAVTDQNFWISVKQHLEAVGIDPKCLSWGAPDLQPNTGVMFDLNVELLLDW